MGVVLQFPWLGKPLPQDGGKARIRNRRATSAPAAPREDLAMDHVDNGTPCDVAYCAPDRDPA
jgi:hypothetical protein